MATNARVKKVFVGGLAQGTTAEDLKQYFAQYGNVSVFLIDAQDNYVTVARLLK